MMRLDRHFNINTYLEETLEYLQQNESLNNLMLGICNRMRNTPDFYSDVYMATVKENDELVLAALMTVPQKLVIFSNKNDCDKAIDFLVKDLLSENIYIPGVIGPKELAKRTCEIWSKYAECKVKLDMNMRVYELREVNKKVIGEGTLRLATGKDIDLAAHWMYEFIIETGVDTPTSIEECCAAINNRIENKTLFLLEHEGKVVSMAGKSRPTENGGTVSLVYTPKELRGKGYATSCVGLLSQKLLDEGYKFCSLFTDLSNTTSNSIYMKIGYKSVGDFDAYIIERT